MILTTLIDTGTLASHLGDPRFVIVDCRYKLEDEAWGEHEYQSHHIPGAAYASLGHDLAGKKTGFNGRHPLPEADTLRKTFGRLGIADGVQVIAYDQDTGMWAAPLVDAPLVRPRRGCRARRRPGEMDRRATSDDIRRRARAAREFHGGPRAGWTLTADEVAAFSGKPDWKLVDARAGALSGRERNDRQESGTHPRRGQPLLQVEPQRRRHVPIAERPPDAHHRERRRRRAFARRRCGSGVTACHNLLALEHAGLTGAKLYPGSWASGRATPHIPSRKLMPLQNRSDHAPQHITRSPDLRLSQGANDPATGTLAGNTVEAQTTQCLKNIQSILRPRARTCSTSCAAACFCGHARVQEHERVTHGCSATIARAHDRAGRGPARRGLLVEIDAIAYRP